MGGHCIGVDPYYIAQKAQEVGYHPEIILSGRKLNDSMGPYIAKQFAKIMIDNGLKLFDSKVLILGITFKENCPDTRNTKVLDLVKSLNDFGIKTYVYDPWIDTQTKSKMNNINFIDSIDFEFDGLIHAVAHNQFKKLILTL